MSREHPSSYEHDYNDLSTDVLEGDSDAGSDDDMSWDSPEKKKKKGRRNEEEEEQKDDPYMLFDFRRGKNRWPENVELINRDKAVELVEKAKEDAMKAAKDSKSSG